MKHTGKPRISTTEEHQQRIQDQRDHTADLHRKPPPF